MMRVYHNRLEVFRRIALAGTAKYVVAREEGEIYYVTAVVHSQDALHILRTALKRNELELLFSEGFVLAHEVLP